LVDGLSISANGQGMVKYSRDLARATSNGIAWPNVLSSKPPSATLWGIAFQGVRVWQRSFILIACVRNRMHYWACSSTVEQGTHNPLVLGSNPGGPTKSLWNGLAALRRGRFFFHRTVCQTPGGLESDIARHLQSSANISNHMAASACIWRRRGRLH
jgi:hypothetical protein